MKIYDISMTLNTETAEWEGDTPFQFELAWTKEQSGSVNVGKITTSTHIGTHIDAPFHFQEDGLKVEQLPLENYVTNAVIVDVRGKTLITESDLPTTLEANVKAVLFHTDAWKDRTVFPKEIPVFHENVVDWMTKHLVTLFGVDLPSVDPITSKDLPFHHRLAKAGKYILEGIVLGDLTDGVYELIALPLKIEGADGSPVRAILIER
ncbi:arylformamidase [Paenisporosarcina cavernae]|uniref:Arylformamidase n=1 Tax=Paenisporosarcina cavernae TaxID=2320858 RepID=A0A385YXM5_9BACL|nr:arylformamidase [Paenisporosarcina cavernae]AYC30192.1 arylformamidase [Paenisporosarcina cavernae]